MSQKTALKFAIRWLACALGLWVAAALLGPNRLSVGDSWTTVVLAGLFLALVNTALKPLVIVLSLPAIILTLGLFMLVVNGFLILLAGWLYGPLYVENFGVAVIAGIIVGFINFLVSQSFKELK